MPPKKQVHIAPASAKHPTNWDGFWKGFFQYGVPAFIAVGTWWSVHQSTSNARDIQVVAATSQRTEAKVEEVKKTADEVKRQGDGQRTDQLKTLAIAAENLAVATKSEKDRKASSEAWDRYDQHVLEQEKIENPIPKSP